MTALEQWEQLGTQLKNDEATRQKMVLDLQAAGEAVGTLNENLRVANAEIARLTALLEQGGEKPVFKWGVASHQCTYRNTSTSVYAEDAKIFGMHDKLPSPHLIRDMLFTGSNTVWNNTILPNMKKHGAKGRTFELTIGNWKSMGTYDFVEANLRLWTLADLGLLSGVAGINEPDDSDNGGVNFSMSTYAAHQKKIYDMMKSDPVLAKIPVANGAIRGENTDWYNVNTRFVQANAPYMDEANWHWYPLAGNANATEQQLRDEFNKKIDSIKAVWDGPIYISECGATTANVSKDKQAWVDMLMLDMCEEANVKCIIYELACDSGTGVQPNFGIFNYDGSPRPAALEIAAR